MAMSETDELTLAFVYEDTVSTQHFRAAQRAHHITNASIHNLDEDDYAIRLAFRNQCLGYVLSVGDQISVDGYTFICTESGVQLRQTPRG